MRTRSHPTPNTTNPTRTEAADNQDTAELSRVDQQISEANELRKTLNNRIFAMKKIQVSRSRKGASVSKAITEQKQLFDKMRDDTQKILKDLESHKMHLTDNMKPTSPFDFVASKAALDQIQALYLEKQNTNNEAESAVVPEKPEKPRVQSTARGKTRASEAHTPDDSDMPNVGNTKRKLRGGSGASKRKNVDTRLLTGATTSAAAQIKQAQMPSQNTGTKRIRDHGDDESTRGLGSVPKKMKQALTLSDDDTLESELTPPEGSSDDENSTIEHKLPVPEPTLPQTTAASTPVPKQIPSDAAGERNVEDVGAAVVAGTALPAPLEIDNVPTRTSVNAASDQATEETTTATVLLPVAPPHLEETNVSALAEAPPTVAGDQTVDDTMDVTTTLFPGSEEPGDVDTGAGTAGEVLLNDDMDKLPLPIETRADVEFPDDSGVAIGATADTAANKAAEETAYTVDDTVDPRATNTLEIKKEMSAEATDESGSDATDDGTTDDGSDGSDSNDDSDSDDSDASDDSSKEMRLANSGDVELLKEIVKKEKGKKASTKKQSAKSIPRDSLRTKWEAMSPKQQKDWEDKGTKQISAYLRSPSTHPIPVGTRAMIREIAELCISACHTTRELALHILENRCHNLFCIFHQKTDKAGRIHDGSGLGGFRVTGTPYPRLANERPKKMFPTQPLVQRLEGYFHCGCSEDEALLEFYWWKMAKATSPATGETEGWLGHRKTDPRTRTLMFQFITGWTHMEVNDIFIGHPAKSDFETEVEQFDTKIRRLQEAKARALEREEARAAERDAEHAKKEAKRAKKEAKKIRRKQKKIARKAAPEQVSVAPDM